ncbi:UDP-N-acetylmuramoyl-L-alanyl-D-glutamate--2,6-diaminopimelate ligase [Actinomarinicola tropica]|uniref:UDP-N-acetylmuramoyl-L-alanyl-D-glutamate--2,6-diaminopimelate ligase n=1 Tax=Actinomarinicola tropica TaxID=2789776 RepID=A0A5Q2RNT0_9ACTN|nr:UDP-N-acetylmuramoyl-L-alanyl-D-glutamate--2,6-diaminopimelate ligase [Actinomarinicola tropica]QGG95550.1 UDP-N-acetylmuramoyl-L-alanyl-D-glutamate--2,6-diaminopimelate ligase [Actinomarinicola tropica]
MADVELDALVATLREAMPELSVAGSTEGIRVADVVLDSRAVTPGSIFCALVGQTSDGHDHAAAAIESGAVALLCERPLGLGVPEIRTRFGRSAMALLASEVHGRPSTALDVVGVTGTNGKTTVTHMVQAILEASGRPTGVIGTLSGVRTTPEAPELQRRLAELRDSGRTAAAIEVSSHALAQHRVDATRFRVAVFTNLSRDHLDYHGTMEAYFQAKARLFEPELAERAVVNLDDPYGRLLLDAAQVPTVGYSLDDAADLELGLDRSRFTWRDVAVELPLGGRFNVSNALAAATTAALLGASPQAVADGLARLPSIAGRFEVIDLRAPYTVVVDFAHTPDGLARVLEAAREVVGEHRVHVVFGCGGDKDRTKRPAMGEVADRLADTVVLTSDNPRSEDPRSIIEDTLAGVRRTEGVVVEPDRRAAIATALEAAGPGDLVIVAGKGHEKYQEVAGEQRPFDDAVVVREEHARLGGGCA